jgi:probable HAF family extracellular repeat protein
MRFSIARRTGHPVDKGRRRGAAAALLACCAVAAGTGLPLRSGAQTLPSFTGVGDLPGGAASSGAFGVSADGAVVVGSSEVSGGTEAFRWTPGGGIVGLGFLSASNPFSEATGISSGGAVVVGNSHNGSGERAFRWTSGSGLVTLGTFSCSSCDPTTGANGVSGDGLVVVGTALARSSLGDPHLDAARWSGGGTGISDLGDLSGPATFNNATGASSNGAVIVGEGESSAGTQGWIWSASTGMDPLVGVPGALTRSGAMAISADASTIVGVANTDPASTGHLEAARWTGSGYGTLELLGSLGQPSSQANAVNADGSRIVGRARNAANDLRAFVWDAANGMRELSSVLEQDYGLDLGGWVLREAHGVSDLGPDGEFTIVGEGINPSGEPEGWVAVLALPACSDGRDNDSDLATDFPADAQCWSAVDLSEVDDCSDGIDNDGDGDVDFPADAGCHAADDGTERPDCSDGVDDDGDGWIDHPADPGCAGPDSPVEDPACDDGVDNDLDLLTDHPADPGCTAASDLSEVADCNDGLDNDGDGDVDHPADSDCTDPSDSTEAPECSDGVDNDGDGRIDAAAEYPDCVDAADAIEAPQCGDGVDNDGDGFADLLDPECGAATDHSESPGSFAEGDLLVVDRASRALFAVDPVGGGQTLLSQVGRLTAPQGIAQRADGTPVVADPAGLVAVDAVSGIQDLRSDPLVPNESLQVVFDPSGDAFVLESSGISRLQWNPSGIGTLSSWLAVPTGEPLPVLFMLDGDSLVQESSGALVTTGFSLYGDGVFRVDATPTATILKPGFANEVWLDLALESDGTLLGVASVANAGPGLYRISPVTGVSTPFSVGSPWVFPTAVAVAPDGTIYVADAGTCTGGVCSGGSLASVDPVSAVRTPIASGGLIQGEMDLVVALPEPGVTPMLLAGWLTLGALARARRRR